MALVVRVRAVKVLERLALLVERVLFGVDLRSKWGMEWETKTQDCNWLAFDG